MNREGTHHACGHYVVTRKVQKHDCNSKYCMQSRLHPPNCRACPNCARVRIRHLYFHFIAHDLNRCSTWVPITKKLLHMNLARIAPSAITGTTKGHAVHDHTTNTTTFFVCNHRSESCNCYHRATRIPRTTCFRRLASLLSALSYPLY